MIIIGLDLNDSDTLVGLFTMDGGGGRVNLVQN